MNPATTLTTAWSLPEVLWKRSQRWATRAAIEHDGRCYSYQQVLDAADRLAGRLRAMGVAAGAPVGVAVEKGPNAMVAFLGVLRSGGVLLPLDPAYPDLHLQRLRDLADVRHAVLAPAHKARFVERLHLSERNVVEPVWPKEGEHIARPGGVDMPLDSPAYVIFTSGSTGRPKGVEISHRALLSSVEDGTPFILMTEGDRCAQIAPLSFDAAIWEHLAPLFAGATVVPVSRETLASPSGFLDFVKQQRITWTYLPPALFAEWVRWVEARGSDRPRQALKSLRVILFAGDVLPPELIRRWQGVMGTDIILMNGYGPTEATVLVCGHAIDGALSSAQDTIPIGRPFGRNRIEVLDANLHPCAPGQVGSIFIGGPQVATRYLNEPALTAEAFVADPRRAGERLYDSRDQGYFDEAGNLVFAGRRDRQVKVRGKRIELEEVERHIRSVPGVAQAAVLMEERSGDKRIAALVAGTKLSAKALREAMAQRVPDYMIPHTFQLLPTLPVNANGKVDYAALTKIARTNTDLVCSPCEVDPIRDLWVEILGRTPDSEDQPFFEAGGDSLLFLRAMVLADQRGFRCRDLAALLRHNTLASWRVHLVKDDAATSERVRPCVFPLAPIQKEMFALLDAYPGVQLYCIQFVFVAAALDPAVLEEAFRAVIRHHPMLRSVFFSDAGRHMQRVLPTETADSFHLERWTLAHTEDLSVWKAEDHARRFDPSRFPLVRASWLQGTNQQSLGLTFFHPVMDGWSLSHLVLQVCAAYRALLSGEKPQLPEQRGHFADYVLRLDSPAQTPEVEAESRWWDDRLAKDLPIIHLPADGPGGPLRREAFCVSATSDISGRVRRRAAELRTTLHRVLLAGYFRLFSRETGRRSLLIGNTTAGRPWDLPGVDQVLGCYIDIQPVLVADSATPFPEIVRQVDREMTELAAHTRLPSSCHLNRCRGSALRAGFCWNVIFALDNFPEEFQVAELAWPPLTWNPIEPFELALSVVDLAGCLSCYWNFRADRFAETRVRELAQSYIELLAEGIYDE
jgi:amino acid adenylation domain-containing protein